LQHLTPKTHCQKSEVLHCPKTRVSLTLVLNAQQGREQTNKLSVSSLCHKHPCPMVMGLAGSLSHKHLCPMVMPLAGILSHKHYCPMVMPLAGSLSHKHLCPMVMPLAGILGHKHYCPMVMPLAGIRRWSGWGSWPLVAGGRWSGGCPRAASCRGPSPSHPCMCHRDGTSEAVTQILEYLDIFIVQLFVDLLSKFNIINIVYILNIYGIFVLL